MRNKIIYVAGAYYDKTRQGTIKNINIARQMGIEVWNIGATAIVPHANTYLFDYEKNNTTKYDSFIEGDLEIIKQTDALYMLKNWKTSNGANIEYKFAKSNHIPIITNKIDLKKFIQKKHKRCAFCNKIRTYYRKSFCSKCFKLVQKLKEQHNEDYFKELNKGFLIVPRL